MLKVTLTSYRKNYLQSYAQLFAVEHISQDGLPDLQAIASSEEVVIIYDHYEKSFEGMTVCSNGRFFIHIDQDSVSNINSGRGRFTLAHELGHALIDEHRIGLLTAKLEPHVSHYLLENESNLIELEADYFASTLLMPLSQFREKAREFSSPFSVNTVKKLARHFQTSLLATLLRFVEIGTESIFVTYCSDGVVKWFSRSTDFPDWPMKFKVGERIPNNTVVGDFFVNKKEKYTEIESVHPEFWFYPKDEIELDMKEQCIFYEEYGYTISILWFHD